MSDAKQVHVIINGRVQGVGYRYFAQNAAQSLGLTGEVRNLADRRVELVAEGPESDLKQLLKRLQAGPALSHVSSLDVNWRPARGEFRGFDITY
ncbi:MAG: acylphosphatase [Candidatus Hinthialibacter antarcticus]|nr:acylphosphatase [Candidatus Hinthialibacter antarcticus]